MTGLINCKSCGNEISRNAETCPHCGEKNKKPLNLGKIISGIILFIIISYIAHTCTSGSSKSSSSTSSQNKTSSSKSNANYTLDIRSDSQKKFEEICVRYASEYRSGQNELQKSETRSKRKNELQQLGIKNANNWIGTLDSLKTNSDGKAIVTIKLNNYTKVCTNDTALFDSGANTLIAMDSNLFQKLKIMKTGDKVKFSGNFFTGDDKHFNKETSLSESGSMLDAEFLFKFTDVTVLKTEPYATENINLRDGPSAQDGIIEELKGGTSVKLLGVPAENGWVKASVDGKEGYVNSKFLTY